MESLGEEKERCILQLEASLQKLRAGSLQNMCFKRGGFRKIIRSCETHTMSFVAVYAVNSNPSIIHVSLVHQCVKCPFKLLFFYRTSNFQWKSHDFKTRAVWTSRGGRKCGFSALVSLLWWFIFYISHVWWGFAGDQFLIHLSTSLKSDFSVNHIHGIRHLPATNVFLW